MRRPLPVYRFSLADKNADNEQEEDEALHKKKKKKKQNVYVCVLVFVFSFLPIIRAKEVKDGANSWAAAQQMVSEGGNLCCVCVCA